jgi:hypothetical protein
MNRSYKESNLAFNLLTLLLNLDCLRTMKRMCTVTKWSSLERKSEKSTPKFFMGLATGLLKDIVDKGDSRHWTTLEQVGVEEHSNILHNFLII